eukprot:768530-Hanusia_phi.AAC.1
MEGEIDRHSHSHRHRNRLRGEGGRGWRKEKKGYLYGETTKDQDRRGRKGERTSGSRSLPRV